MANDNRISGPRYSDGLEEKATNDPRLEFLDSSGKQALANTLAEIIDAVFGGIPSGSISKDVSEGLEISRNAVIVDSIVEGVFDEAARTGEIPKRETIVKMGIGSQKEAMRQERDLLLVEVRVSEHIRSELEAGNIRLKRLGEDRLQLLIGRLAVVMNGVLGKELRDSPKQNREDIVRGSMIFQSVMGEVLTAAKRAGQVLSVEEMLDIARQCKTGFSRRPRNAAKDPGDACARMWGSVFRSGDDDSATRSMRAVMRSHLHRVLPNKEPKAPRKRGTNPA